MHFLLKKLRSFCDLLDGMRRHPVTQEHDRIWLIQYIFILLYAKFDCLFGRQDGSRFDVSWCRREVLMSESLFVLFLAKHNFAYTRAILIEHVETLIENIGYAPCIWVSLDTHIPEKGLFFLFPIRCCFVRLLDCASNLESFVSVTQRALGPGIFQGMMRPPPQIKEVLTCSY